MTWSSGLALRDIRLALGLDRATFAYRLAVTPPYVSLLEADKKTPSRTILRLASHEFAANLHWLETGEGEPFGEEVNQEGMIDRPAKDETKKRMLVAAAILVPLLPSVAAGLAITVGTEEIIDRMKKGYGAKNLYDLAVRFLNIDPSVISKWKLKNKIPDKYIEEAAKATGLPIELLLFNETLILKGRTQILDFIKSKIIEEREVGISLESLEREFDLHFPLHTK